MSNHKSVIKASHVLPITWSVRCRCRWGEHGFPTEQAAEDAALRHIDNVRRAKAAASVGNLKSDYLWYKARAEDPTIDEVDRIVWQQLADGLVNRINRAVSTQEESLW